MRPAEARASAGFLFLGGGMATETQRARRRRVEEFKEDKALARRAQNGEFAEKKRLGVKRREVVELERGSPPFANGAKDGAPC